MDINTVRVIRSSLNDKEAQLNKSQDNEQEKDKDIKGCLKLADYMAF